MDVDQRIPPSIPTTSTTITGSATNLVETGVVILYTSTFLFGLAGNAWVLTSVWRSRPLNSGCIGGGSGGGINKGGGPSTRLRHYIGLLAFVDMLVTLSLLFRIVFLALPQAEMDDLRCQCIHVVEQLVRTASLACLVCISLERYITIRKPFRSSIRKRLILITPISMVSLLLLACVAMILQLGEMGAIEAGMNCGVHYRSDAGMVRFDLASWVLALILLLFLATITTNYAQIVHHVKRKFWQRKCRSYETQLRRLSVALLAQTKRTTREVKALIPHQNGVLPNSRKLTPLPVPRYMRDMTSTIVRIGVFHTLCWLPYCILQFFPYEESFPMAAGMKHMTTNVRFLPIDGRDRADWVEWVQLVADWLTYVNSAGDWIFYAAMNRELRSIIKATTERRKRSAFSQHTSPRSSNLRSSLQKQMTISLRLFYSINSFRLSMDEGGTLGDGSSCGRGSRRQNSRATPRISLSPSLCRSSRGSKSSAGCGANGDCSERASRKISERTLGFSSTWNNGTTAGKTVPTVVNSPNDGDTMSVFSCVVVATPPPSTPNSVTRTKSNGEILL